MDTSKLASRFTHVDSQIYLAKICASIDTMHGLREFSIILRIDGRGAATRGVWRCDMASFAIWEAIDGGEHRAPRTLKDARAFMKRWIAAVTEQKTLQPRMPEAA